MAEKLTLEQLDEIKKEIQDYIAEAERKYREAEKSADFDGETIERILLADLYKMINEKLLSKDLSDIPASEWKDWEVLYGSKDFPIDLSQTHANIDFSIIPYSPYVNYKGCNIVNLDKVDKIIDSRQFDEEVIKEHPELFISDIFDEATKTKIYSKKLTLQEFLAFTDEQLDELKDKNIFNNFGVGTKEVFKIIGMEKTKELLEYSEEDFKEIYEIFDYLYRKNYKINLDPFDEYDFKEKLNTAPFSELKSIVYERMKQILFTGVFHIEISELPEMFVKDNGDLLLTDENIDEDLRRRFYERNLTGEDIIDNISLFKNIPVEGFTKDENIKGLTYAIEDSILYQYIEACPDLFKYLVETNLASLLTYDLESNFDALDSEKDPRQQVIEKFSTFFQRNNKISDYKKLELYNPEFFELNEYHKFLIDMFGFENFKKFEKEVKFFFYDRKSTNIDLIYQISFYLKKYGIEKLKTKDKIDFKDGELSYEEFCDEFAKLVEMLRKNNFFTDFGTYDYIEGDFREKYPEIFVSKDAPEELRKSFYLNRITPDYLHKNKDKGYIPYLLDKNPSSLVGLNLTIELPGLSTSEGYMIPSYCDFSKEYVSRHGIEKYLNLLSKYGEFINEKLSLSSFKGEIDNEQEMEKLIRKAIYKSLYKKVESYHDLYLIPEMVEEYPNIFIDIADIKALSISDNESERILKAFYQRALKYQDLLQYPRLVEVLKDKDLKLAFGRNADSYANGKISIVAEGKVLEVETDLALIDIFGNERFLELCSKYGNYLTGTLTRLKDKINFDDIDKAYEEFSKKVEELIERDIFNGDKSYTPEIAPAFLKEKHPELFLNEDAPEDLVKAFYGHIDFKKLSSNKEECLPFLEGKDIVTALKISSYNTRTITNYFELFGKEKGLKLGISKAETVTNMIASNRVDLMKQWYDKSGGKFIPDYVVMYNLGIEEADKFFTSGANWSALMKIPGFARTPEARTAMLKIAYTFGAFDHDTRGFKKTQELLSGLPRKIDAKYAYILKRLRNSIADYLSFGDNEKEMSLEEHYDVIINNILKDEELTDDKYRDLIVNLFMALKKEKFELDFSKSIFEQIYRKSEDNNYTLTFNTQSLPKTTQAVRAILEIFGELPILTPNAAHHYFDGFNMRYDPDFREFFFENFDKIFSDDKYLSKISIIQRRFPAIKVVYSNVNLTLDLALSYVSNNQYDNVNVGNERVSKTASLQNYSQQDFEMLQQIFNYGKQRVFSSIPRIADDEIIELPTGKYHFEILRLDDSRAMSIGFESNCCQHLGGAAEECMEHSMTDKNGRVFIITNEIGEVVAQSWVWRNKDVLCFDNIEVPDQKMWDSGIPRGREDDGIRNQFTDDVLEIYKMAAKKLMELDEEKFKELLEAGKITQEQYDGLRLRKVTTGLGYSNVKGSLKTLEVDKTDVARPLHYELPVQLTQGPYTADSETQYILEEREGKTDYHGATLPIYSDEFIEHDNSNFTETDLFTLEALEIATKGASEHYEILADGDEGKNLVTLIARNYGFSAENTRIVMNPNFAIIYDIRDDKVEIGDIFFNTHVDNGAQQLDIEPTVIMQMKLALDQIIKDREVILIDQDEKQKEMYAKAMALTDELDVERGVGHAR